VVLRLAVVDRATGEVNPGRGTEDRVRQTENFQPFLTGRAFPAAR
jgi:hypothetical protein